MKIGFKMGAQAHTLSNASIVAEVHILVKNQFFVVGSHEIINFVDCLLVWYCGVILQLTNNFRCIYWYDFFIGIKPKEQCHILGHTI